MSKNAPILNFIFGLVNIRTIYEEIKHNEESKKVSVVLGKKALGYCFLFALFVSVAAALAYWGSQYVETIAFFFGIILIVIAIGCGLYALSFLAFAFSCSMKQIRLNRKPIGIFALVLTLLLVAVVIAVACFAVAKLK